MERECFEDQEVANLLNSYFVSIKLDREERPDIDGIYMSVCKVLPGQGGWPLTVVMASDKKPFFAGTYETTFKDIYLCHAIKLAEDMKALFWDSKAGGFYFYGTDGEKTYYTA